jgi:hypothetical protein
VIVAATAAAALLHSGTSNSPPPQISAQQRAADHYNTDAVSWVISQVSRDTTVSCDQAMCAALVKAGFPQGRVQVLGLGASAGTPLSSQIVVETPDVRRFFGTSLDTVYAPTVLTVEGSGPENVVIGAVAPRGPAAYQKALQADLHMRKADSATLLDSGSRIVIERSARDQLAAGLVDTRLQLAIIAIGTPLPVTLIDFGNIAQGASQYVPLRYADIADPPGASDLSPADYERSVIKALNVLPASQRPIHVMTVTLAGGSTALRIVFSAPSPFNALGPGS